MVGGLPTGSVMVSLEAGTNTMSVPCGAVDTGSGVTSGVNTTAALTSSVIVHSVIWKKESGGEYCDYEWYSCEYPSFADFGVAIA